LVAAEIDINCRHVISSVGVIYTIEIIVLLQASRRCSRCFMSPSAPGARDPVPRSTRRDGGVGVGEDQVHLDGSPCAISTTLGAGHVFPRLSVSRHCWPQDGGRPHSRFLAEPRTLRTPKHRPAPSETGSAAIGTSDEPALPHAHQFAVPRVRFDELIV
jgi:hypothetical protein